MTSSGCGLDDNCRLSISSRAVEDWRWLYRCHIAIEVLLASFLLEEPWLVVRLGVVSLGLGSRRLSPIYS